MGEEEEEEEEKEEKAYTSKLCVQALTEEEAVLPSGLLCSRFGYIRGYLWVLRA